MPRAPHRPILRKRSERRLVWVALCLCLPLCHAKRQTEETHKSRWSEGNANYPPPNPKVLHLVFPQNIGRVFARHLQNPENPGRAPILSYNICRGADFYFFYFGFSQMKTKPPRWMWLQKLNILWHRLGKTAKPPDPENKPTKRSDFFGRSVKVTLRKMKSSKIFHHNLHPPPQHYISQCLITKTQRAYAAPSDPDVSATLIRPSCQKQ